VAASTGLFGGEKDKPELRDRRYILAIRGPALLRGFFCILANHLFVAAIFWTSLNPVAPRNDELRPGSPSIFALIATNISAANVNIGQRPR
jgi:hypothetical protein